MVEGGGCRLRYHTLVQVRAFLGQPPAAWALQVPAAACKGYCHSTAFYGIDTRTSTCFFFLSPFLSSFLYALSLTRVNFISNDKDEKDYIIKLLCRA